MKSLMRSVFDLQESNQVIILGDFNYMLLGHE